MEATAIVQLIICLGILVLFIVTPWMRRVASAGLPLCFIFSLAMIHWLGGLIHALPDTWHTGPDPYTALGFQQAFWATVAFALGGLVVAPFVLKMTARGETRTVVTKAQVDQSRLPMIYIFLGISFFTVLA